MSPTVAIRLARASDRDLIFGWRNDPFIVALGSSQRTVTWEEHSRWFADALASDDRVVYVIENRGEPIGQVRFDRADSRHAIISIYVLQAWTGKGLGVSAIRAGSAAILQRWDVDAIVAHVREDNAAGAAGFIKAGFGESAPGPAPPPEHRTFALARTTDG